MRFCLLLSLWTKVGAPPQHGRQNLFVYQGAGKKWQVNRTPTYRNKKYNRLRLKSHNLSKLGIVQTKKQNKKLSAGNKSFSRQLYFLSVENFVKNLCNFRSGSLTSQRSHGLTNKILYSLFLTALVFFNGLSVFAYNLFYN